MISKLGWLLMVLFCMTGCAQSVWITPGSLSHVVTYQDWTNVQPGVDFEQISIPTQGTLNELFDIVRIDPKQASLKIAVDQDIPKTVSTWQETLGASVVINASYFDDNFHLLTKTITPTQSYGKIISGKTGLVSTVSDTAPQLWSISSWQGDPIQASWAIQSYPLLVDQSHAAFTNGSNEIAQRTIIAQDADGKVYLVIAETGILSLADLSAVLADQFPIQFTEALNFDGGTSTGLVIHSTPVTYQDDSLVVPAVLYLDHI